MWKSLKAEKEAQNKMLSKTLTDIAQTRDADEICAYVKHLSRPMPFNGGKFKPILLRALGERLNQLVGKPRAKAYLQKYLEENEQS